MCRKRSNDFHLNYETKEGNMTKREFIELLKGIPDEAEIYIGNCDLDEEGNINDIAYYEPEIKAWNDKFPIGPWVIYPNLPKQVSD
jgi:hypothetical protein